MTIKPKEETNSEWLARNGELITNREIELPESGSELLVCLICLGTFSMGAIIYDKKEFNRYVNARPTHPKFWYLVKTETLQEVCETDILGFYMESEYYQERKMNVV